MSLVTRCPACGTTFKVVRDQLRISDGWVRCGRCSEVFDATLALQETPDPAPDAQAPAAPAVETPVSAPSPTQPEQEEVAPPSEDSAHDVGETDFLDDEHEELEALRHRARHRVTAAVHRAADQVEHLRAQVRTLSPLSTLERGYAVVQHADGVFVVGADVTTQYPREAIRAESRKASHEGCHCAH